jgi:hypothetical protein
VFRILLEMLQILLFMFNRLLSSNVQKFSLVSAKDPIWAVAESGICSWTLAEFGIFASIVAVQNPLAVAETGIRTWTVVYSSIRN